MNNSTLEGLLGMIVFGPMTATLEGKAFTIDRLREAARFLEYSFAEQRRRDQSVRQQVATAEADDGQQNQLAPAKPKRQRGRPAKTANGAADHGPGLASPGSGGDPLFQTADSALTP